MLRESQEFKDPNKDRKSLKLKINSDSYHANLLAKEKEAA